MKETSLNVDAEHWWGSIIGGAFGAECAVKYVIYDPYYVLEVGGKERRTRRFCSQTSAQGWNWTFVLI